MTDLSVLTEEDWVAFQKKYPAASAFLQARSLTREYQGYTKRLSAGENLTAYENGRYIELELIYGHRRERICA